VLRMTDIQTVSIVIASAGVFVAAIYYILQIRHQTKVRQTDLVMRLYSTYGSPEFQEASMKASLLEFTSYDDLVKNYPKIEDRIPVLRNFHSTAAFFEGVGVLLHRKLIDIDLVDDLLSTPIIYTWDRFGPFVKSMREYFKRPQIWEWFEYLYNEMKKREQGSVKNG